MTALAGFLKRTDFVRRLRRTFLIFYVPIVGTAVVLALATALIR